MFPKEHDFSLACWLPLLQALKIIEIRSIHGKNVVKLFKVCQTDLHIGLSAVPREAAALAYLSRVMNIISDSMGLQCWHSPGVWGWAYVIATGSCGINNVDQTFIWRFRDNRLENPFSHGRPALWLLAYDYGYEALVHAQCCLGRRREQRRVPVPCSVNELQWARKYWWFWWTFRQVWSFLSG